MRYAKFCFREKDLKLQTIASAFSRPLITFVQSSALWLEMSTHINKPQVSLQSSDGVLAEEQTAFEQTMNHFSSSPTCSACCMYKLPSLHFAQTATFSKASCNLSGETITFDFRSSAFKSALSEDDSFFLLALSSGKLSGHCAFCLNTIPDQKQLAISSGPRPSLSF